jgi:all-trans-retinol 13,14-reductase
VFDVVVADAMSPQQRQYDITSGRGEWKKLLKQQFPQEEKAINEFFAMVHRVHNSIFTWLLTKVLPVWVVNVAARIGIFHLFSPFFDLGRKSVKQITEV